LRTLALCRHSSPFWAPAAPHPGYCRPSRSR
jgi:hypothetical protein